MANQSKSAEPATTKDSFSTYVGTIQGDVGRLVDDHADSMGSIDKGLPRPAVKGTTPVPAPPLDGDSSVGAEASIEDKIDTLEVNDRIVFVLKTFGPLSVDGLLQHSRLPLSTFMQAYPLLREVGLIRVNGTGDEEQLELTRSGLSIAEGL